MPRRLRTFLVFSLIPTGLVLAGIALLAPALGIDNDAGWGALRITLLVIGLMLLLLALVLKLLAPGRISGWLMEQHVGSKPARINSASLVRARIFGIIILLSGAAYFVWYVSEGTWSLKDYGTSYYPLQAQAFLAGQLHLPLEVPAALQALDDPYDANQRQGIGFLHDASLFQGRYYIYWGPVPALLSAAWKLFAGEFLNDAHLVLLFYLIVQLCLQSLTLEITRHFFPHMRWYYPVLLFTAFALNAPLGFVFGRASVYEAAILGGQAFLLLGALMLWQAYKSGKLVYPFLAGLSFAAAIGSRNSVLFAAGILILAYLFWLLRTSRTRTVYAVLALSLPLIAGVGALAWFNDARFGSPFEPGMRYALTVVDFSKEYPFIVSPAYIPANLYLFLFNPPALAIPLELRWVAEATFPFFLRLPDHYYFSEPVVGLLFVLPFLINAWVPLKLLLTRRWPYQTHLRATSSEGTFQWLHGVVLLAGLAELLFIAAFFAPMMRYLLDAIFLLLLAAGSGWSMAVEKLKNSRAGTIIHWSGIALVLYSVWLGSQFIAASHAIYYGS